jgi:hypothetical protein
MASSQLKRAEHAIEKLREEAEVPPAVTDVLTELVDLVRSLELRLATIENNSSSG